MKIYDSTGTEIFDTLVSDSSYRYRAIMGENSLTLYFSSTEFVEIPIGSYCDFEGQRYTLESPENFKKYGTRNFEYTLILESPYAKLKRYKFRNPVDKRLKFDLTAKPIDHLQMLVDNLNARDSGWSVGSYIDAVEKVISYNHTYCSEVLQMLADEFETEWEIVGKTINLKKVEYNKADPLALSYGKGNGFRPGVGRANYSDSKPVEILYVQGGERNIDFSAYGSRELLLPKSQTLVYEGRTYQTDADGLFVKRQDKPVVYNNEDSIDCSHIYPSRVGTVSSVDVVDADNNFYDIIDSSIPEDLDFSQHRTDGETITIIFQSGMLAGKEFEIEQNDTEVTGYIHAERRFKLVPQEIDGQTMPNDTFIPAIGDTYAVFGISLPDAYVCDNVSQTGASWDMFREAVKYLYENEDQKFSFTGELDGIWAKTNWSTIGAKIKPGGYVSFSDAQAQTESVLIRIVGVKDYINKPHYPEIELSNAAIASNITSNLRKIETNEVVTESLHKEAVQYTKRRYRDAKQTLDMLNASLLHYSGSINPITVETMALLVGDESLQFRFVDGMESPSLVAHNVSYDADTKILTSPAGTIQHMTLGISSISPVHNDSEYSFWELPVFNSAALSDGTKSYYLYGKVSDSAATGEFILSETAIGLNDVAGYYHLLVGVLNSELDGDRSYVDLYGFSEVLPGRITTDKISNAAGTSYFDMLNSAFKLSDKLQFNVGGDGKLKLKGTLVQSEAGTEFPLGTFRGYYDNLTPYYKGDKVTYQGSEYLMIYDNPVSGIAPPNMVIWTITSQKGDTGDTGATGQTGATGTAGNYIEYQYAKNGSTTTAPDIVVTDLNPSGWSVTPPSTGAFEYLWMAKAVKNASGTSLISNWTTPVRIKGEIGATGATGATGQTGATGPVGPLPMGGKDYNPVTIYYGNSTRVDIVKYGGTYYVARVDAQGGSFSGVVPTNTSYWNVFGSTFESVATDLLFASLAYIDNLGVKYLRTGTSGQRVFINGADGSMHFYNASDVEIMSLASGILTAIGAVLNGATIKSATTGQRVVIDGSTNRLQFFDSSNNEIVRIGEDIFGSNDGIKIFGGRIIIDQNSYILAIDEYGIPCNLIGKDYISTNQIVFAWSKTSTEASVNSAYLNSSDGKLYFKDGSGVSHALY